MGCWIRFTEAKELGTAVSRDLALLTSHGSMHKELLDTLKKEIRNGMGEWDVGANGLVAEVGNADGYLKALQGKLAALSVADRSRALQMGNHVLAVIANSKREGESIVPEAADTYWRALP